MVFVDPDRDHHTISDIERFQESFDIHKPRKNDYAKFDRFSDNLVISKRKFTQNHS